MMTTETVALKAEILDLTIDEANGFLKAHNIQSGMTTADIEEGRAVLSALLGQWSLSPIQRRFITLP